MYKVLAISKYGLSKKVDWHEHDYWEMVYCTKGNGRFLLKNGDIIEYNKNELVVLPPKMTHCNISEEGFENIYLSLDHSLLPSDRCAHICDTPSKMILNVMFQAYYIYYSDIESKKELLQSIGNLLNDCLYSLIRTKRYSETVEKIQNEIIKNLSNAKFNANKIIVDKIEITEYMRKVFKKETGMTPLQFLIETRISNAKKLLMSRKNLGLNISEISFACGYDDTLYFSKAFKQHEGVSPKAFSEMYE